MRTIPVALLRAQDRPFQRLRQHQAAYTCAFIFSLNDAIIVPLGSEAWENVRLAVF